MVLRCGWYRVVGDGMVVIPPQSFCTLVVRGVGVWDFIMGLMGIRYGLVAAGRPGQRPFLALSLYASALDHATLGSSSAHDTRGSGALCSCRAPCRATANG